MCQKVDEVGRLGPVPMEDQSASLPASELELELIQSHMAQKPVLQGEVGCALASVRVRYGRLTGVSGCVRCGHVRLMNLALLRPALRFSARGDAAEVLGKV